MTENSYPQLTPLTARADRSNHNVRLFEEAILKLRGRWPANATGLCADINRQLGFSLGARAARERVIESRIGETLRLVEALYGPATVDEVRRAADEPPAQPPGAAPIRPRLRDRLRATQTVQRRP